MLPAVAYAAAAGAATYTWPDVCLLRWPPPAVFTTVGVILLAIGLPMWMTAVISVMRAYDRDELITSGVFALVRHPVYAAWIVLNLPGIALLFRSWPLMLTPLLAYTVFKLLIRREGRLPGAAIRPGLLDYRARVNEVCPIPDSGGRAEGASAAGRKALTPAATPLRLLPASPLPDKRSSATAARPAWLRRP